MILRIAATFCLFAVSLFFSLHAGDAQSADSKTLTIQHGKMGVIQATWSQSLTPDSVNTNFLLTNLGKGKLFELTQEGSLWSASGAFPLDSGGDIGFLIVSQVGAKAMDAKVVAALMTGDVRQVAEWSGGQFTTTKIENGQILVMVREYEVPHGIPKYYAWDGKSMIDVSSRHPELYRKEIEDIENTIIASNNYPAYYYAEECRDLSIAFSYSHNDSGAQEWC